jgi:hypothetical protein
MIDFVAYANRNTTVRISLKDGENWLAPPFTTGYFAIAPLAVPPVLQSAIPPIFKRNTRAYDCWA